MAHIDAQETCKNHPFVAATFQCADCGKMFCDACKVSYEGADYCTNCRRLNISVVLTKIRTWRVPLVVALILGTALGYGLFTGFIYLFADRIIGGYNDTVVALAIMFVACSALLAGIISGLLTREKIVVAGIFTGLLLLAVHVAVDFMMDYFELPIEDNASNLQRFVSISYYAMLAGICGTFGGLIAWRIRRIGK